MPFQPVGDAPRWKLIFEFLEKQVRAGRTEVITFAEFEQELGFGRAELQGGLQKASAELLDKTGRTVESVYKIGYKLDTDRLGLAKRHQKKGVGQLSHAADLSTKYDETALTPAQRDELDRFGQNQMAINAMLSRQISRNERELRGVKRRQAALETHVDERFSGLEKKLVEAGWLDKNPEIIEGEVVEADSDHDDP